MYKIRRSVRVLAAAVSSACAVAAMPAYPKTISIPDTCSMVPVGNDYQINCTGTSPSPTPTPTPTPPPTPPPTPTPTGTISCAGAATTRVVDLTWSAYMRVSTTSSYNDATVFRFTVPMTAAVGSQGRFNGGYLNDLQPYRKVALSSQACDFSSSLALGAYLPRTQSPMIQFSIGSGDGYYPGLQPGGTYYVNVLNLTCAQGANCSMYMDVYAP